MPGIGHPVFLYAERVFHYGALKLFRVVNDHLRSRVSQTFLASVPPRHGDGKHPRVQRGLHIDVRIADEGAFLRQDAELASDG